MSSKRSGHDERPTIEPPFDPQVYARESERKLRVMERRETTKIEAVRLPDDEPITRPRAASAPSLDPHMSEVRLAQASRPMLEAGPDLVPIIVLPREDLEWFDLDPQARELLSHIDGVSMLGVVLTRASGVSDAITVLSELAKQGIVAFKR